MANKNLKKIGVVLSNLEEEYQRTILEGIKAGANATNECINILVFAASGGTLATASHDAGEFSIFQLINYSELDGLIYLANTIQDVDVNEGILHRAREAEIPIVSIGKYIGQDASCFTIDNYDAMYKMVEHLILEHNIKTINFVTGGDTNIESQDRYRAFVRLAATYDLPLEGRVYPGFFRSRDGKAAVESFIENKDTIPMPQAIVFANDNMALAGITELEKHGYSVPEDILVTGFDNILSAQNNSPQLSTIERPLKELGGSAVSEILRRVAQPESPPVIEEVPTYPIFTESCGHTQNSQTVDLFKELIFSKLEEYEYWVSFLNKMSHGLRGGDTLDDTLEYLKAYVPALKAESFNLCLCEDWLHNYNKSSMSSLTTEDPKCFGIMSNMLSYGSKKYSILSKRFDSTVMLADVHESTDDKVSVFVFSPVHYQSKAMGYAVLQDCEFAMTSKLYPTWLMNVSLALEDMRKLTSINNAARELERVYITDPLCGILNRGGFTKYAEEILREAVQKGSQVMVGFVDMDGLKKINDTYGHKEGDASIKLLASTFIDVCRGKKDLYARWGGDEFIVLIGDSSQAKALTFKENYLDSLQKSQCYSKNEYSVEASVGVIVLTPTAETSIHSLIHLADEEMYAAKIMKKKSKYIRRTPEVCGESSKDV